MLLWPSNGHRVQQYRSIGIGVISVECTRTVQHLIGRKLHQRVVVQVSHVKQTGFAQVPSLVSR
jgi:hypothetical protein